ncbi:MAG: hypothetical protein WAO12_07725, partial [Venatoribacter sp.]
MKKELMLLASLFSVQVLAADVASFEQQAKQQTQGFGQQLQVVLKQGLESGGALHAIELCNTQAPA